MQDFWNSWYAAVANDPRHFFYTNLIRFPEGTALNYHSFAYTQLFVLVLLSKLLGTGHATLILLHNATLLLSFPLAGTGAFYLVRHYVKAGAASLIGGFVFAFNPSHIAHVMHHAHVAWIGFIPFCVLAYLKAFEQKNIAWLGAAIVLYALCALSCWYYLFYIAYFIIFHTVYLRFRDDRFPTGWKLIAPLACIAGTMMLLSPLLVPMILQSGNPNAYNSGSNEYVADLAAYFAFPPTHLLAQLSSGFYARLVAGPWEGAVYLGLINLGLLVWLAFRAMREKDPLLIYVLCGMLTFCVLAGGETLHAFGHDFLFFHLPDVALDKLPFVANVRTPSRAVVMVYLFLSIGVGHALALMWNTRTAFVRGVAVAAAFLLLLDFYPAHLDMIDAACPAGLDVIAHDPDRDSAVLNLPGGYVEGNAAMFQQTCHGHPILQGNVSRRLTPSLIDRLKMDDLAAQREQLIRAHVKFIVLSQEKDGVFVWRKADGPRSQYALVYPTVYHDANVTVLRVY